MKVLAFPADDSACGAYRIIYPAQASGVDVRVEAPLWPRGGLLGERAVQIDPEDTDVVVCHRPSYPALVDELERLQADGHALVVDVDDDLSRPHPEHAWARGERGATAAVCQKRACDLADLVTVSTPALAERYGAHGRVVVLPNRVPERLLPMPRESDGRTLGWGGLASGHPGDLQAAHGGAGRALAGSGWRFLVIGPAEGVRIGLGLTQAVDATGGLSLEGYHEALGSLDVGIAPLNPSPFNRAKSGLKCLEYAARGVPYVASPSPEYTLLAGEGVGLLATDALQWRRHLTDLMQDETLREHHREHGRAVIAEKHTYERHGHLWPEAWESAMRNRDQRRSGMCSERPVSRKRSLVGPGSVRREAAP